MSPGLASLARSLAINVLVPALLYAVLERVFPAPSPVPLWSAAAVPAIELVWELIRRRSVDAVAVISLSQLSAAVLISLIAKTPRAAMAGHAFQAAALGLLFAVTAAVDRPLMLPLARQAMCGDDAQRQAGFDAATAPGRPARRQMTYVSLAWAAVLCAETGARLIILRYAAPAVYLLIAGVMSWAAPALLTLASIRYGQWMQARMKASGVLAPAAQAS